MLAWMLPTVLNFGSIYAFIPVIIIIVLIAAATGLSRGWNMFALFGITAMAGLKGMGAGRGLARKQYTPGFVKKTVAGAKVTPAVTAAGASLRKFRGNRADARADKARGAIATAREAMRNAREARRNANVMREKPARSEAEEQQAKAAEKAAKDAEKAAKTATKEALRQMHGPAWRRWAGRGATLAVFAATGNVPGFIAAAGSHAISPLWREHISSMWKDKFTGEDLPLDEFRELSKKAKAVNSIARFSTEVFKGSKMVMGKGIGYSFTAGLALTGNIPAAAGMFLLTKYGARTIKDKHEGEPQGPPPADYYKEGATISWESIANAYIAKTTKWYDTLKKENAS